MQIIADIGNKVNKKDPRCSPGEKAQLALLFLLVLSCLGNAQKREDVPDYRIKITGAELTREPARCRCEGASDFPDSTVLQLTWSRILPDGIDPVAHQYTSVVNGRFTAVFGPFPHKTLPGSYHIVAFFSPGRQRGGNCYRSGCAWAAEVAGCGRLSKLLAQASFVEDTYPFRSGSDEEYAAVFARERQWMEEMLSEVKRCFDKSDHDCRQSRTVEDWYRNGEKREEWVASLREKVETHRQMYLQLFFPECYFDLHALINLVEMFHEAVEIRMCGEGDAMSRQRFGQFHDRYLRAQMEFRYHAIAMAPEKSRVPLIIDEIQALKEHCQKGARDADIYPDRRSMAIYLLRIRQIGEELKRFPDRTRFLENSNSWLLKVRQFFAEIERPQLQDAAVKAPPILYDLVRSLLGEWEKRAASAGFPVKPEKSSSFERLWDRAARYCQLDKILVISMSMELQWLQSHIAEVMAKLRQEFPPDWEALTAEWTAELLRRQEINRRLASWNPEKSPLLTEYLCLCAYLLDLYDLLSQSQEFPAIFESLDRVAGQIDVLEKMLRESR